MDWIPNTPTGSIILAGSVVTWTYTIQNTGNVGLTSVSVRDDNGTPQNPADDFTVCTAANLAAGSSQICTRSGTALVGQFKNIATATGTPPIGPESRRLGPRPLLRR